MVVALGSATSVNNGNKCPHGFPVGSCPICSPSAGGGGSIQDKNKPRVPGEMSYNECMAAWLKIQAAKEAKIQAQIDKLEGAKEMRFNEKIALNIEKNLKLLNEFINKLDNIPKFIAIPAKLIVNVLIKPILNLISKIPLAINNIQQFLSNVGRFVASVSEKLSSLLGEVKNFLDAKVVAPFIKKIKTIFTFFSNANEDESDDVQKLKAKEIKKVLKGIFRIKNRNQEKEVENED